MRIPPLSISNLPLLASAPLALMFTLALAVIAGGAGAQGLNDTQSYVLQRQQQQQSQQRLDNFLNQTQSRQQQIDNSRNSALSSGVATSDSLRARQDADVARYRNGLQSQIGVAPPPRIAPHRVPKPPYAMPPRLKPTPPPE